MNGRQTASSIFRRQFPLGCWKLLRGTIHSLPRAKNVLFSVAFGPLYGSKQKKKKGSKIPVYQWSSFIQTLRESWNDWNPTTFINPHPSIIQTNAHSSLISSFPPILSLSLQRLYIFFETLKLKGGDWWISHFLTL